MSDDRKRPTDAGFGSSVVVAFGLTGFAMAVVVFVHLVGWNATWRALGVTPLQPPFFDMHVINDYAACAARGMDAYTPHSCNIANFNIPPAWLWLGRLGIDGTASAWISVLMIGIAAIVMLVLFSGRSWFCGTVALVALLSPSVLMGVERGNLDLLILALVGTAALTYDEGRIGRSLAAVGILGLGTILKLLPMFCVSLVVRASKRAFLAACILFAAGAAYLILVSHYVVLIRRNVPTTFVLSYGYKAIFLGVDHMRVEAGLSPWYLSDTWLPFLTAAFVLLCSVIVAISSGLNGRRFCSIDRTRAGTAFLFGAGIYCGTYLLGTNFIYRLVFLVLCVPQLMDWMVQCRRKTGIAIEAALLTTIFGVLWLNGNSDGHTKFLLLPQVLNWFLFFFLTTVLIANLLHYMRTLELSLLRPFGKRKGSPQLPQ